MGRICEFAYLTGGSMQKFVYVHQNDKNERYFTTKCVEGIRSFKYSLNLKIKRNILKPCCFFI